MVEVKWPPPAADDPGAICLFIARDSPRWASAFADRALGATDRLAYSPRSGRIIPELGRESLREIGVGSYRFIYRVQQEGVHLLNLPPEARPIHRQLAPED